jgi:hypothetical protein
MHAAAKLGGWAVLVALTATGTAFATPADAATGPTATLDLGTPAVDGTAERDVLLVRIGADRVTLDIGLDGTVEAEFPRPRLRHQIMRQFQSLGRTLYPDDPQRRRWSVGSGGVRRRLRTRGGWARSRRGPRSRSVVHLGDSHRHRGRRGGAPVHRALVARRPVGRAGPLRDRERRARLCCRSGLVRFPADRGSGPQTLWEA